MDEDVDYFDMRGRFKVVEKRKRDKNVEDDSDSDSSSVSSSDDSIREYAPRKPTYTIPLEPDSDGSVTKKPAPPAKKRRPIIALSTDEEEENSEPEPEAASDGSNRSFSLTPPPVVAEEALQQALAVINDHVKQTTTSTRSRTRQQTSNSTTVEPFPPPSSDGDDDFDLAAYQNSMNSDIAKQAAILYGRQHEQKQVDARVLLILVGKRFDGETLPTEWIKPIGLKVMSTMQFRKLKEEFKKQRGYTGDVILVLKGLRLYHGTPQSLGLKDQTVIDVFTEYGYKVFEEREKEKAASKLRTGAIELSSDEEEDEQPPQPEIVVLHLQGPLGKYRFRLPNTSTIRKVEAAYRRQCQVPATKQITIELDGEILPEDKTIAEMDLEGEELLDVVVKDA